MIYRMRSGVQRNHLPKEFGDDASFHRTFQRWVKRGVLGRPVVGHAGQGLRGAARRRLAVAERRLRDGQGPARGDQVGPNPTDRAKAGTKRGVPTGAGGGPVAVALAPANRHDSLVLQDILEAVVVEPPNPVTGPAQHLCLDKAFDGDPSDATARVFGYEPHVRRIGEEKLDANGGAKHPAR
ncbi:MAG TPA: IS5/IS1182 family transposase, partial [Tepidisphaeraceae bacterium]|nr:IS5/IS1182 family transposase [Tepidisphaeraceae bacterium]